MNKKCYTLFLSAFLFTTINCFSQGGNTCASAAASPITIPFAGTGSNCAATVTDDYDMVGGSCIDPLNTQGPDWLYYFCAPTTGTINVSLTNFTYYCYDPTQVAPFPSLSVWQGCPGVGTCSGGSSSQGTPDVSVEISVTAGQCYYILIDNYPGYCPCFDYSLAVNYVVTPPTQPACTNMGFDAGGFAGWTGSYGYSVHDGPAGSPTPTYTPTFHTTASPMHTITSGAGVDPFGGFPVVAPGGGTNSCMLGDASTAGYGGATLEQTFNVTVSNALLIYNYAVVIQNALSDSVDALGNIVNDAFGNPILIPHKPTQQPFFKIEVFDCAGNPIVCGQYLVVGGAGIPGFFLAGGTTDIYYRPWTPVAIDLTPYIGTCAKLKFTVGDCSLGAHFAYAYIDVKCAPMAITGVNMICPGSSTTLSAPSGEAAYSWAPGGQTTSSITVSPAVATTYTCTVTSVSGPTCTSVLTYPVALYPAQIASSTSSTICSGTSATLNSTVSSAGGTYSWAPGGQTTASITVSPTVTTAYTCTYTDLNGCADTALGTVNVNPLPTVTVPPNASYCDGATVPTANFTSVPAGATFTWTNSNPAIGMAASGTGSSIPSFTATNAGAAPISATITVTPTSAAPASCLGTPSSYTITVNPIPTITVNSPSVCPGVTATLTAGGGTTYTWSAGATPTGVNTATVSPVTTTTYTVTGTTAGCSNTAIATVSIGGVIIVNVNSPTICNGQTATLTATGGTTYTWTAGVTPTGINTATASPTTTTSYTVTGNTGGCTGTAIATVTVNPIPVVVVNSPSVCPGAATTLTAGGATTYTWSAGATSTGVNTASVSPASTGTYTVTGTSLGCTSTAISTVTVYPATISNAGPDVIICTGGVAALGTTTTAGYNYSWSPAGGLSSINISNPTATLTNGGTTPITNTYIVTTTDATTGCQSTDAVNVIVNAVATANAGSTQYACTGSSITLAGAVGGSATSGTWSGGGGTFSPNNTTLNAVYTPTAAEYAADSVILTLTTNDPAGPCTFASSNVTLHFYPKPIVHFSVVDPNGCPVHCADFTDLSTVGGGDNIVAWSWNFGDGSSINTTQNPSHCYPITGFYDVTLTVTSNHGCTATLDSVHAVQVYSVPTAEFLPTPNPATIFDPVITMNNQSSSDVNYWYWSFGDGDTLAPNTPSPIHTYPNNAAGTYNATLIVHNANGCWDTVSHLVDIGPEFTFYIPNAFTPNGDGINDFFFGTGIGIIKYDIWIFDRWGNMIYHSNDLNASHWDGRANGGADVAQQDVYVWKVRLTDVFDKHHAYIGTVTIVK